MDKLWRVLYSPRRVFDELRSDLQIMIPLVTVLVANAISWSIVYSNPWWLVTWPLGYLVFIALLGAGFYVVGKICRTDHSWTQWIGFVLWMQVPLAITAILDVLLTVLFGESPTITLFTIGNTAFPVSTATMWWAWTYIISIHGLRSWTSKSRFACIGLALLPHLFLMLPWLLIFIYVTTVFIVT